MLKADPPYHAHIYYDGDERVAADALRERFTRAPAILFVGKLTDRPVGPHPIPQFEIHFLESALSTVIPAIEASGLRALVHGKSTGGGLEKPKPFDHTGKTARRV